MNAIWGSVVAFIALALCAVGTADGAPATRTVSDSYGLGDNDSRADGRRFCIALAKQRALDAIGTVVESELIYRAADAGGVRRDEAERRIRSYVAGMVAAEPRVVSYAMDGDRIVVTCSVDVTIDADEIRAKLQGILVSGDRKRLDDQQARMDRLQAEIARLGVVLDQNISAAAADAVRYRRGAAQAEADRIAADRADIIRNLQAKTASARDIRVGMTKAEVVSIAGQPRGIDKTYDVEVYNYGALWVTIEAGTVHCVSRVSDWACTDRSQIVQR